MNLLIINDYGLEGGGAEIRIKELVERLIETKTFEKIHLLEHSSRNSQSVSIIIHRFNSNIISKTIDIINQNQITHVQVHNLTLFPVQLLASIKKKTSVKIIFFAHDYWAFCGRRNMVSSSQKICLHAKKSRCFLCIGPVSMIHIHNIKKMLNYCDVGIAPSTFVKNIYSDHNILRNKWIIIPPWIDPLLFPFHLSSTLKNTLLFVGPLIPAKGIDLLIDALLIVERKIPFLTLHICGPGQEITSADKKRIDQKIVALHSTSVIFLGMKPLSELAKEYYTATISITCPLWPEVFGQTWAQSLSCGTPTIVTAVGSIPELAAGKAVLVNPTPSALAEGIITILTNVPRKSKKTTFTLDNAFPSLLKVYNT